MNAKLEAPVQFGLARYRLDGISINRIDSWYEAQLPSGKAWNDWIACEHPGRGVFTKVDLNDFSFGRLWYKSGGPLLSLGTRRTSKGAEVLIIQYVSPAPQAKLVC